METPVAHRRSAPPAHAAHRFRLPVLTLAAAALLAGCGSSTGRTLSADSAGTACSDGSGDFGVTVDNCCLEVRSEQPPRRMVSSKTTAAATMLALGLGDLLVGTAFADGPVPDRYA